MSPNCMKLRSKVNSTTPIRNPRLKFAYVPSFRRYPLFSILGVFLSRHISFADPPCAKIDLKFVISAIKNTLHVIFKRFHDIDFSPGGWGEGGGGIHVPKHVWVWKWGFRGFRGRWFQKRHRRVGITLRSSFKGGVIIWGVGVPMFSNMYETISFVSRVFGHAHFKNEYAELMPRTCQPFNSPSPS